MRADNSVGDSTPSPAVSGTPATVPGQPTITDDRRGNATISVSYAESSTGGSAIVAYQYSTDAGVTWHTASSNADPMVITTLSTNGTTPIANGTEYPVEIRAVNAVGDSLASSPVEARPPRCPVPRRDADPGQRRHPVAATVTNNGGSAVTGIDYSLNGGPFISTGTTSSDVHHHRSDQRDQLHHFGPGRQCHRERHTFQPGQCHAENRAGSPHRGVGRQ